MHTVQAKVGEQIIPMQSLTPLKLHDWQISHVAFVAQFVAFGCIVSVLNLSSSNKLPERLKLSGS